MPSKVSRDPQFIEETLELDPECPACKELHGISDVFDGSERRCWNCRRPLVAVAYEDMMVMELVERQPWQGTHRERTRRRWNRQGRRG